MLLGRLLELLQIDPTLFSQHSTTLLWQDYITEDVSPAYLQSLESSIRTQDKSLPGQQAVMVCLVCDEFLLPSLCFVLFCVDHLHVKVGCVSL